MTTARLYQGDAIEVMRRLPAGVARCCVTSPPYWGLRDYGTDGQLGMEATPHLYVERMVEVFRELRRVLTDDGTVWLNLGDSYASKPSVPHYEKGHFSNGDGSGGGCTSWTHRGQPTMETRVGGLKPKDLTMMPARVALALQADGWWVRSLIIWAKPNGMPESVRDRPSLAHEYLYLLAKSESYFFDNVAIAEELQSGPSDLKKMREGLDRFPGEKHEVDDPKLKASSSSKIGRKRAVGGRLRSGNIKRDLPGGRDGRNIPNDHARAHRGRSIPWENEGLGRNARTVWTIPVQPYQGAHFATFPEELARRCILAGTSQAGHCPDCGAPWVRITESEAVPHPDRWSQLPDAKQFDPTTNSYGQGGSLGVAHATHTIGWEPSCRCPRSAQPVPDVVIDPFGGSGTVAQVATGNGRESIYIDLNPKYLTLAEQRIGPILCARCP